MLDLLKKIFFPLILTDVTHSLFSFIQSQFQVGNTDFRTQMIYTLSPQFGPD